MAIVDVTDIEAMSNQSFDDQTTELITGLIDDVQGEVEGYLGRPVEPTQVTDEAHVVDYMGSALVLANTPVREVTSVTADGLALDTTGYTVQPWGVDLVGYGIWFPGNVGLPGYPGPTYDPVLVGPMFAYGSPGASGVAGWPYPGREFKVSYTGGLDGFKIPALQSVIKRNVLRLWTWVKMGDAGRGIVDTISVEDFTVRHQVRKAAGAAGFLEANDIAILAAWKRKSIG